MKYFVAGGMYKVGKTREFKLVRPTGNELPYVATIRDSIMERHSRHHSHLYEYNNGTVTLIRNNGEANLPAPQTVKLTAEQHNEVLNRIASEEFCN